MAIGTDENGDLNYFISVQKDISERRQYEKSLIEYINLEIVLIK